MGVVDRKDDRLKEIVPRERIMHIRLGCKTQLEFMIFDYLRLLEILVRANWVRSYLLSGSNVRYPNFKIK